MYIFGLFISSSSNEFAGDFGCFVVFQGTEITDEDLVREALWPSGGLEIVGWSYPITDSHGTGIFTY